MEANQLLQQAFQLRKEKKYKDALDMYTSIFAESPQNFGEWDAWSFAWCYRGLRQYGPFLDTCRIFYKTFSGSALIKELYAWSIYYSEIAHDDLRSGYATLKKAVEAILSLSPPGTAYGCAERALFKWVKHLSLQMQPDWAEINRWLNFLDPAKLATDTYTIDRPGGKKTELASDREEWYSWKSKALLHTAEWQGCIEICNEAAGQITKWHYSNDIWFARRKAAALSKLGHLDEAKAIIEHLLTQKREWFLLQDLAELVQEPEKGLDLCVEAALMQGDMEKKVRLFRRIADLYQELNQPEQAYSAALLCLAIRHHMNWPIPADLEEMIRALGTYPSLIHAPGEYLVSLQKTWEEHAEKAHPTLRGRILSLLPDKRAGFIRVDGGEKNIYFSIRDWHGKAPVMEVGLPVRFKIGQSWDRVKQRKSEKAIHLTLDKSKRNERN